MIIFINIILSCIGLLLIKRRLKDYNSYVNHFAIFGFIWLFITIGTQLSYPKLIEFSTVLLFYAAWYSYIIGSSIIRHKKDITQPTQITLHKNYAVNLKFLGFGLFILCFIANYDLLEKVIFNFSSFAVWATLRTENEFVDIDERSIFKTLFQRSYLIYVPIFILLLKNKKISKTIFICAVVSGVIISILKFTRAPFLQLMITILVSYIYIYQKKLPLKTILLTVLSVFLIFIGSTFFLLGKRGSMENVLDEIKLYLFGGQIVYQDILNGKYLDNYKYDVKVYSIDFINYILERLELIDKYPLYVREWSKTLVTNTYTYLDSYTLDMGIGGAILGSFLTGFFSDYIYSIFNKNKNIFTLVFYAYICYFSAFVFANNEFIRFSVLLTAVNLWVLNIISKRKSHV